MHVIFTMIDFNKYLVFIICNSTINQHFLSRYLASSVFIFLQNGGCISAIPLHHPASGSTLKTIRLAGTLSVTATCFTVTSYDIQESFRGCGFVRRNRNILPVSEAVIHSCCWCWRKNSATKAPTKFTPATIAPAKFTPTTIAPAIIAPTINAPAIIAPTINAPAIIAPTTNAPYGVTIAPTTIAPATIAPAINSP